MLFLLFFCFSGGFAYQPPEGSWLDYARTGPISTNRVLIVEQKGQKGEYHLGATQKIMDIDGQFLYDIPVAQNAWVIHNGVLGDEDTFWYQNRGEHSIHLWHPEYGDREFVSGELVPGNSLYAKQVGMAPDSKRFVFISEPPLAADDTKRKRGLRIEIAAVQGATPTDLFLESDKTIAAYFDLNIETPNMSVSWSGKNIAFHKLVAKEYAYFDLEGPMDQEAALKQVTLPFQIKRLAVVGDYVSIWAFDPKGMDPNLYAFCLLKLGQSQPLIYLDKTMKNLPGFKETETFLLRMKHGTTTQNGAQLSLQLDGTLQVLDVQSKALRMYPLTQKLSGASNPATAYKVECDAQQLVITPITPAASQLTQQPNAQYSLSGFNFKP